MGVNLSEDEVTARGRPGPARIKYFFQQLVASGAVFIIDDTDGTLMLEDREGRTVLPVWPTPGLALAECDPQAGNVPGRIEVVEFAQQTVPRLADQGIGLAIFPIGAKIAISMNQHEFWSKLGAEARRQGRADLSDLPATRPSKLP